MSNLAKLTEEELFQEFCSRGRAGGSLLPIHAENHRRRMLAVAAEIGKAAMAAETLARFAGQMLVKEDCDVELDERWHNNHFRGAILDAIEILSGSAAGRSELMEKYLQGDES